MSIRRGSPAMSTDALDKVLSRSLDSLTRTAPSRAIHLLGTRLESSIANEIPENLRDYSSVWRPTISNVPSEFTKQNHTNLLVSKLRDALVRILSNGFVTPAELRDELAVFQTSIFRRIEMDVLAEVSDRAFEWSREYALSRDFLELTEFQVEYWKLTKTVFPKLSPDDQQELLRRIVAPTGATQIQRILTEPSEAVVMQRDRLWSLHAYLDKATHKYLEFLVKQFGAARDLTEGNWPRAAAFGPATPIDENIIKFAPVTKIVESLSSWSPSSEADHLIGPSPEGASRQLKLRVSKEPAQFTSQISILKQLEATYLRGVIEGFISALRSGTHLEWPAVLELCNWIAWQDPDQSYEPMGFMGRDPNWTWARRATAHLLLDGLSAVEHGIPYELRPRLWSTIDILAEDRDPEFSGERLRNESAYANQAINSVRGTALLATTEYARWVSLHEFGDDTGPVSRSFAPMPEALAKLEQHLILEHDSSPIVRAIYGQQFSLLLSLDSKWAASVVTRIFGNDPYESEQSKSAWESFLVFSRPSAHAFRLLKRHYELSVARLRTIDVDSELIAYDDRKPYLQLSEHVFLHAITNESTDVASDNLLNSLLSIRSSKLASHLMWFASTLSPQDWPLRVSQQLRSYIEWRIASAKVRPDEGKSELDKFGAWVVHERFDEGWRLAKLAQVVRLTGTIDQAYQVIESLVQLVERHPELVVESIEALVCNAQNPWVVFGSQDSIYQILKTALSVQPNTADSVRRIASHMIRRGWLEFSTFGA